MMRQYRLYAIQPFGHLFSSYAVLIMLTVTSHMRVWLACQHVFHILRYLPYTALLLKYEFQYRPALQGKGRPSLLFSIIIIHICTIHIIWISQFVPKHVRIPLRSGWRAHVCISFHLSFKFIYAEEVTCAILQHIYPQTFKDFKRSLPPNSISNTHPM